MFSLGFEFAGVFVVKSADIDEKAIRKEKPEDFVIAIAEAKVPSFFNHLDFLVKQFASRPELFVCLFVVFMLE